MTAPERVRLDASPSTNGAPTMLHHRERGAGTPALFLHGGWGYGVYPFDAQMDALAARGFRALAPDRSGYGRSTVIDALPLDFHARAAREMTLYLDALHVDRALLWGHSDGAVIAAHMALHAPERFPALVLESLHRDPVKRHSRAFFETAATDPGAFGARVARALEADHGARWRDVVRMNGRAWLALAAAGGADLFGGRLRDVTARALVLHGARDPRTEPGELAAILADLPRADACVLDEGQHSPHSEERVAGEATARGVAFLADAARALA